MGLISGLGSFGIGDHFGGCTVLQEGLPRVYGDSILEKLKTCEFHFLQSSNRQRPMLHSEKYKELFTRITRILRGVPSGGSRSGFT